MRSILKTIILDCDPGIDDATAIILAFKSGLCRFKALTTVAGNVPSDIATRNVVKLLYILGMNWFKDRDPKLAKGTSRPLFREIDFKNGKRIHGEDGFGNTEDLFESFRIPKIIKTDKNAIDLLVSSIIRSIEPITLVATGPLTNIAKAIIRDPRIKEKLNKVIIMGGAIEVSGNVTSAAEFNIYSDPEAAKIVFQSDLPIILVPLDVTGAHALMKDEIIEFREREDLSSKFIYRALSHYMTMTKTHEGLDKDSCFLHDALAMGIAINDDLMRTARFKEFYLNVETTKEAAIGQTIVERNPSSNKQSLIEVCFEIDFQEFMKFFKEIILK